MGLFGLWNYENYLLNLVVTSRYARNGLVMLLIYLVTSIARFHLSLILTLLFTFNNSFDLVIPIIITVLVAMISDVLFQYAETHRSRYEELVEYLIDNYSVENYIRWKRNVLMVLLIYVLIGLAFVQIDNYYIFLSLVQTTIGFIICDLLEQKLPQSWYNYLLTWWNRPQVKKFMRISNKTAIINNYQGKKLRRRHSYNVDSLNNKSPHVPPIRIERKPVVEPVILAEELPPKPLTPPVMDKLSPIILAEELPPKPLTPPIMDKLVSKL